MMNLMKRTLDMVSGSCLALISSSLGMMIVCSSMTPSSGIQLYVFLK